MYTAGLFMLYCTNCTPAQYCTVPMPCDACAPAILPVIIFLVGDYYILEQGFLYSLIYIMHPVNWHDINRLKNKQGEQNSYTMLSNIMTYI